MSNLNKLKLAWKYRKYLWKYRKLLRHRRQIGAVAAAGTAIAAGIFVRRRHIEWTSAQPG